MRDLIDRQAFIENERKLYCEDCDRRKGTKNGKPNVICYEIGEAPCRACWLDDALTDLEDFPTASPWHRGEEPPKENGRYLVSWEGAVTTDEYKNGVWLYASMFNLCVTHWMTLPEPPKEDA